MAGKNSRMKGFTTEPVDIQVGRTRYRKKLCVAPIADDMLLGHDLLHQWGAVHDVRAGTLQIGHETVPLDLETKSRSVRVARVTAARQVTRLD